MCSKKQRAANRANAQKSSGPTSAEGKSIVSHNAVRHGLRAGAPIVLGENREDFDVHAAGIREEFRPATPMENVLVDRIVEQSWKIRRVPDAEREAFVQCERTQEENYDDGDDDEDDCDGDDCDGDDRDGDDRDDDDCDGEKPAVSEEKPAGRAGVVIARSIHSEEGTIERLQCYEQRIERSIQASIRALRQLRKQAASQSVADAEFTQMTNKPILPADASSPAPPRRLRR